LLLPFTSASTQTKFILPEDAGRMFLRNDEASNFSHGVRTEQDRAQQNRVEQKEQSRTGAEQSRTKPSRSEQNRTTFPYSFPEQSMKLCKQAE